MVSNYVRNINVNINALQDQKLKQSGLSDSEYTRRAIDAYDEEILYVAFEKVVISFFGKDFVKNNKEMVKNFFISGTNHSQKTSKNKENLYQNKESLYQNKENLYQNKDKSLENDLYKQLQPEFFTIQKLLQNPLHMNSLPETYVKKVMKEYNISKQTFNNFIAQYKQKILELDIDGDYEIIHHEDSGVKYTS